ncbi:unnamed protein product [Schistocephalus solidus]|uniref:non-specific serine/threonine protein kinase n=1 Tax=Schistocephalus solidus TaxID=70667 RepID=A0A183SME8_SCHSO|nr:unnamed protein product [Schistocephalus solidus]
MLDGALPFDDDNLRNLLEKVKKGIFQIPPFVPPDCQSLLRAMIEVDPKKRIQLSDVLEHPWVISDQEIPLQTELPMSQAVQTSIIPSREDVDPDIFSTMTSLQCFRDEEKLYDALLSPIHNTEKVIYFLLLDRKIRSPCYDDPDEIRSRSCTNPPRKRIDSRRLALNGTARLSLGDLSEGSPLTGRRGLAVQKLRKQSCSSNTDSRNNTPSASPLSSPLGFQRGYFRAGSYEGPTAVAFNARDAEATTQVISSPTKKLVDSRLSGRRGNFPGPQSPPMLLSPTRHQCRLPVRQVKSPPAVIGPRVLGELSSTAVERRNKAHLHLSLNTSPVCTPVSPSSKAFLSGEIENKAQEDEEVTDPKWPSRSGPESLSPMCARRKQQQQQQQDEERKSNGSAKRDNIGQVEPQCTEMDNSDKDTTTTTTMAGAVISTACTTSNTSKVDSLSTATSPLSPQHWRSRLSNFKVNFLGSPRFHRKKAAVLGAVSGTPPDSPVHYSSPMTPRGSSRRSLNATPEVSPLLSHKSWFDGFLPLGSHNGQTVRQLVMVAHSTAPSNKEFSSTVATTSNGAGRQYMRQPGSEDTQPGEVGRNGNPVGTTSSTCSAGAREAFSQASEVHPQKPRTPGGTQAAHRLTISRKVLASKLGHNATSPNSHLPPMIGAHQQQAYMTSGATSKVHGLKDSMHVCNHMPAGLSVLPEETNHVTMVKGRTFNRLKSEIAQVLLSTPGVVHTILTPTTFRAEYRRAGSGSSLLARPVKMQIDIVRASNPAHGIANGTTSDDSASDVAPDRELYAVNFQLLSGPARRFKRLCEQLQAPLLTGTGASELTFRPKSSPVPTARHRAFEATGDSDRSSFNPTGMQQPNTANYSTKPADPSNQWAFIDSFEADSLNPSEAACSISTLCSQFEATLAVNDSQLESIMTAQAKLSEAKTMTLSTADAECEGESRLLSIPSPTAEEKKMKVQSEALQPFETEKM